MTTTSLKLSNILELLQKNNNTIKSVLTSFSKDSIIMMFLNAVGQNKIDIVKYILANYRDQIDNKFISIALKNAVRSGFEELIDILSTHVMTNTSVMTNTPVITNNYILSQKGITCAVDGLYNILFDSDELKPFFTDPVFIESMNYPPLYNMFNRWNKMKYLEKMSKKIMINTTRTRSKSLNKSVGTKTVNNIMKKYSYPGKYGISSLCFLGELSFLISDNRLLPPQFQKAPIILSHKTKNTTLTRNVYAIIIIFRIRDHESHVVVLYRKNRNWIFADNEFGIAIPILDKIFVPKLLVQAHKNIENIHISYLPETGLNGYNFFLMDLLYTYPDHYAYNDRIIKLINKNIIITDILLLAA